MGLYLEPEINKKAWLDNYGTQMAEGFGRSGIDYETIPNDEILVCCVDNGFFLAAAVAFSEDEFKAFDSPDGRPKYWYSVKRDLAKSIAPMWDSYMKGK